MLDARTVQRESQSQPAVRWLSVVGARPQFVKLAPLCRAIEGHNASGGRPRIEHAVVHTGQHYDRAMTDVFFAELGIPEPDFNLGAGSGGPGEQLGRMLKRLEPVLKRERPEWVIVYGDTNSTLAGAVIAARLTLPVAHVEAGCRSYNAAMPEEQNRVIADALSRLLLAASQSAVQNLAREGIGTAHDRMGRKVVCVGDVMKDALEHNVAVAEGRAGTTLARLGVSASRYYLLTLHRAENTASAEGIANVLASLAGLDLPVVFPLHPRTRAALRAGRGVPRIANLIVTPPIGYLDMLAVEKHCRAVLTDSGGVQKEAFYLRVPCVTLREETEWPETVALGGNRLAGTDARRIAEAVRAARPAPARCASPFGDGHASERIVKELLSTPAITVPPGGLSARAASAAAK